MKMRMSELCDKNLKAATIKNSSISTFEIIERNEKKQKDSAKKQKFSVGDRGCQGEPSKRANKGKEHVQEMGSTDNGEDREKNQKEKSSNWTKKENLDSKNELSLRVL